MNRLNRRGFPGLTVDLVDAGKNYEEVWQKFNAALSGGALPDVETTFAGVGEQLQQIVDRQITPELPQ